MVDMLLNIKYKYLCYLLRGFLGYHLWTQELAYLVY